MSRSVLVTGANRGIGLAVARVFAAAGDRVTATYRTAPPPPGLFGVRCDVTDTEAVDYAFTAAAQRHGPVEVVVANAGITRDALLLRMTEDDFTDVVDTNLTAAYRVARRAVPAMLDARSGRLVFISSAVVLAGEAGQVNYAAAKAGLIGLARSLTRELAPHGITSNVVAPGYTRTDMTAAVDESGMRSLAARLSEHFDRVDGLVHAIAFAPATCLGAGFLAAPWSDVATTLRVSTHSLAALGRGGTPADVAGGSVGESESEAVWQQRSPLGWDPTDPRPVATACVALLSPQFSATTGSVIHVDGGYHAMAWQA